MTKAFSISLARFLAGVAKTFLTSLFLCGLVSAQLDQPQERVQSIFKDAMRADAILTREIHQEFWSWLRKFPHKEQTDFLQITGVAVVAGYAYQAELWESMLLSYRNQKVVKTGRLMSLETDMRKNLIAALPQSLSSTARAAAIREYESRSRISMASNEQWLEAAANHETLDVPGRARFAMNEHAIQQMKESIDGGVARMQRLLNPVWSEVSHTPNHKVAATPLDDVDHTSKSRPSNINDSKLSSAEKSQLLPGSFTEKTTSEPLDTKGDKFRRASLGQVIGTTGPVLNSDAGLAQEKAALILKEKSRPSQSAMLEAAIASSTDGDLVRSFQRTFGQERHVADPTFRPNLHVPEASDSRDFFNKLAVTRNQAEYDEVLQRERDDNFRIKTVMDRGPAMGYVLLYSAKYWWLLVVAIIGLALYKSKKRKPNTKESESLFTPK